MPQTSCKLFDIITKPFSPCKFINSQAHISYWVQLSETTCLGQSLKYMHTMILKSFHHTSHSSMDTCKPVLYIVHKFAYIHA